MHTNRSDRVVTLSRQVWWAAEQQATHADVTLDEYLTWLISRDTMRMGIRTENPLHKINNTLEALKDTLTTDDLPEALHTLDLAEGILRRIGDADVKACLIPRTPK